MTDDRDYQYNAEASVLKQLDQLGRMLPPLREQTGYRFSRSAAIRFAEGLLLLSDGASATKYVQSDQAGMLSFWELAQHFRSRLNPGPYKPEQVADQFLVYGNLGEWLLAIIARSGRSWVSDEDPVIPRERQLPRSPEEP